MRRGNGRSGGRAPVPALLALVTLGLGCTAGLLLSPSEPPPSLAAPQPLQSVDVVSYDFRDPRGAPVTVSSAPGQSLRAPTGGLVTSFPCSAGAVLASGSALFSVDGTVVVGLATSLPLWRSLEVDDEGADVAAVQAELVRLGKALVVDGLWGRVDAAALADVMAAAGGALPSTSLDLSRIAWLPAPTVETGACLVAPGDRVAPGDALADFPSAPATAQVADAPADALGGDRVISVGGGEYPVPPGGLIVDPAALAAIVASLEYRQATAESPGAPVTLDYLLATALRASSVPPSAVYDLDGASGRVCDASGSVPVEVVASRLGQTLVIPERPIESVRLHPDAASACR